MQGCSDGQVVIAPVAEEALHADGRLAANVMRQCVEQQGLHGHARRRQEMTIRL